MLTDNKRISSETTWIKSTKLFNVARRNEKHIKIWAETPLAVVVINIVICELFAIYNIMPCVHVSPASSSPNSRKKRLDIYVQIFDRKMWQYVKLNPLLSGVSHELSEYMCT